MLICCVLVAVPYALVAVMVTVHVPAAVGVPVSTPVGESARPAGRSCPVMVTGPVPVTGNACEYAAATVPPGAAAAKLGASPTVTVTSFTTLPDALAAPIVNVYVPAWVGVPDSTPAAFTVRPVGSVPDFFVTTGAGLPPTVNAYEYAWPVAATGGGCR